MGERFGLLRIYFHSDALLDSTVKCLRIPSRILYVLCTMSPNMQWQWCWGTFARVVNNLLDRLWHVVTIIVMGEEKAKMTVTEPLGKNVSGMFQTWCNLSEWTRWWVFSIQFHPHCFRGHLGNGQIYNFHLLQKAKSGFVEWLGKCAWCKEPYIQRTM